MDDVKKWTFYLIMLVAGFATGIGTIGLFPQMWLKYGITGLVIHVVALVILTVLAINEAETVMRSGYYFAELYYKVRRKPGMMIAFLTIGVMFLSYYTGNVGLSLLSPFLGTGTFARLVAKVILITIIFVVISRAKEKTFTIMALGSLFLVLIIPALTILSMSQIPKNAEAISSAWRMLFSSHPITFSLLREVTDRAIYAVGLGFGFYIMLGSFLNERFNPKVIIGTGVFIQFILGILSTIAIIYIAAPTDPSAFNEYVAGGEEAAIALLGKLPDMLANHTLVLYAIGLTIFMAGLTSILPNSEVALQILQYLLKTSRNRAAIYLMGLVLLVGVLDSPPSVANMMLRAVSTALFVTAIFEMYPIVSRKEGMTPVQLGVVLISGALFIVGFLTQLGHDINLGGIYYASAFLALIVVLVGLFGEALMPETKEGA